MSAEDITHLDWDPEIPEGDGYVLTEEDIYLLELATKVYTPEEISESLDGKDPVVMLAMEPRRTVGTVSIAAAAKQAIEWARQKRS